MHSQAGPSGTSASFTQFVRRASPGGVAHSASLVTRNSGGADPASRRACASAATCQRSGALPGGRAAWHTHGARAPKPPAHLLLLHISHVSIEQRHVRHVHGGLRTLKAALLPGQRRGAHQGCVLRHAHKNALEEGRAALDMCPTHAERRELRGQAPGCGERGAFSYCQATHQGAMRVKPARAAYRCMRELPRVGRCGCWQAAG